MRTITSLFCILVLSLVFSTVSTAQETVTIPVNDLKQLQKIAAEREFYKSAFEDEQRKSAGWQQSSSDWKKLYESEKLRADEVQGGRIAELLKANAAYKDQAALDRQRLSELEFSLRKAKGQRKWYFAAGLGLGAVGGAYGGSKINF